MATAAHAIREAARALAEGRGYKPEPPLFELDIHRAKASPGTLHITNPALPERQVPSEESGQAQRGTETNILTSRRPGYWAVQRPNTVFPKFFPLFFNSTQIKHRNTQARESRGNALDHPEPRPKPNRWEISARTPGPMQNSEHPWTNQQAKFHQDVTKATYPKVHPKLPGKSCQHLVPPKVAGPHQASSPAQGKPPPGKAPPPAPEYRGHPGPILARCFATPPDPVGVPHTLLKLGQAPVTHSKNGLAALQCDRTNRRWTKQKNSGNRRIDRKQQPMPSLTKCSSFQRLCNFG